MFPETKSNIEVLWVRIQNTSFVIYLKSPTELLVIKKQKEYNIIQPAFIFACHNASMNILIRYIII